LLEAQRKDIKILVNADVDFSSLASPAGPLGISCYTALADGQLPVFSREVNARRLLTHLDAKAVVQMLETFDYDNDLERRRLGRLLVAAAVESDMTRAAIASASRLCAIDPELSSLLPLRKLADMVRDSIPADTDPLSAAVVLDVYMKR